METVYIPLFFTYRDHIFGNGFMADVISHGRVLAATEDNEHWVYGVQPGSFAATGEDPADAFRAYRESYRNVLFDLAEEAESSHDFEEAVTRMFSEVNSVREQEWKAAVEEVRAGNLELDIKREDAETENYVKIGLKHPAAASTADNHPAQVERALAA